MAGWALCLVTACIAARGGERLEQALVADVRAEITKGLAEYDEAMRAQAGQPERARQLFASAAKRMAMVSAGGVMNGLLEYNTGNAYLQAGDVGRAILHYRRAERLIPGDALLKENLSVALSRRLTNLRTARSSEIMRTVFFWHFDTSTRARTHVMLGAFVACWGFLTLRCWVRGRWTLWSAAASGVVCAGVWVSVALDRWTDRNTPAGVIIATDVVVQKGPATTYARQFEQPLQAGAEFRVRERRSGWLNIELIDGNSGWVPSEAVELVPGGP